MVWVVAVVEHCKSSVERVCVERGDAAFDFVYGSDGLGEVFIVIVVLLQGVVSGWVLVSSL